MLIVSINLSLYQLTDEERALVQECARNAVFTRGTVLIASVLPTILDKTNEKSEPPLPPFQ